MLDLHQQIRDHYDSKTLLPQKAKAILASGQAATGAGSEAPLSEVRPMWLRRMAPFLALAAAIVVFAGVAIWWDGQRDRASYTAIPLRIISFFGDEPTMSPAAQDKEELWKWHVARGAPRAFRFPAALLPLESAACHVLEVGKIKTYLSCFWNEGRADRGPQNLVHLLVADRRNFADSPTSPQPVFHESGDWSFASWADTNVLYTLAAAAPVEQLRPFLSSTAGRVHRIDRLSALRFHGSFEPASPDGQFAVESMRRFVSDVNFF